MPAVAAEWALPTLSIVNMRSEPRHSAELASQALMGMPVRIIERQGDWCLIETILIALGPRPMRSASEVTAG